MWHCIRFATHSGWHVFKSDNITNIILYKEMLRMQWHHDISYVERRVGGVASQFWLFSSMRLER